MKNLLLTLLLISVGSCRGSAVDWDNVFMDVMKSGEDTEREVLKGD